MHKYVPLFFTVAAGTTPAAPVSATWTIYPGYVSFFRVQIASGHSGLTGFRLVYHGRPVIPDAPNLWLVGDGETHTVPWEDEIMNTGLVAQGYNTDIYPHNFRAWAEVNPYIPGVTPRDPGSLRQVGGGLDARIVLLDSASGRYGRVAP